MSYYRLMPIPAEKEFSCIFSPNSECAVTPLDLLKLTKTVKGDYQLYEAPLLSALTGETAPGPLFHGLKDSMTIPLLLCRDGKAGAVIITEPIGPNKRNKLTDFLDDFSPEMFLYDFSDLRSIEALNKHYTDLDRRWYLEKALSKSEPESKPEDKDPEFCEDEHDQDWWDNWWDDDIYPFDDPNPIYAGEEYQEFVHARINLCAETLDKDFSNVNLPTFETVPVSQILHELGFSSGHIQRMENKHLIEADSMHTPTPFGRQCGLMTMFVLSEDGSRAERELKVLKTTIGAFKKAVCYSKSMEASGDPRTPLTERISNLKNWSASSPQSYAALIPKLRKTLIDGLKVPICTIQENMEKINGGSEFTDSLLDATGVHNQKATFHELLQALWNKLENDTHPDTALNACDNLGYTVYVSFFKNKDGQPKGQVSLSERLRHIWMNWMPIADMQLWEYFQAQASVWDSSYPLWLADSMSLPDYLKEVKYGPQNSLGSTINKMSSTDDVNHFMFILLVQSLGQLKYTPN